MNRILESSCSMNQSNSKTNGTDPLANAAFIILCSLLFVVPALAGDKKEAVRYFVPGKYSLTEGEQHLCGEGDFYLTTDGTRLWLGPYYSFRTTSGSETVKSGLPNEKDCTYQAEDNIAVKGKQSTLTSVSTLLCGQTKRQVVTNTAVITKQKITLDQSSQVDPHFAERAGGTPHHCAWLKAK